MRDAFIIAAAAIGAPIIGLYLESKITPMIQRRVDRKLREASRPVAARRAKPALGREQVYD